MEKDIDLGEILAANITKLMDGNESLNRLKKVAAKAGVGHGTVARAKNKEASATLETVEKLARAFGLSPLDLLTDDETRHEIAAANKMMELYQQLPEPKQKALLEHATGLVLAEQRQMEIREKEQEVPPKLSQENHRQINPR